MSARTGETTTSPAPSAGESLRALPPRLMIAGTHSGVGKTTVATGLMAAWRARGVQVASAKVGPDFIDPGYHELATGRPGRNLDPWMCGLDSVGPLAGRAAHGAELLVVEGVMGLFDGAADATASSSADVARELRSPVVLVVDGASTTTSLAATVHGFMTFDERVRVAGVIINRIASDRHEELVRRELDRRGVPVFGVLRRDDQFVWRDRHLGLVPVVEQTATATVALERLAVVIERSCDLDALERLARSAPARRVAAVASPARVGAARIAVATGAAFSFLYRDNVEALAGAGAEIVPLDPLSDERLPDDVDAVIVGGGFPEVYVEALAENRSLLRDVRERAGEGLVLWAECGGLLWLGRSLDGRELAGVLDSEGRMTSRLTLGYRTATVLGPSPLGAAGTRVRGHEFHYSTTTPSGTAMRWSAPGLDVESGFASPTLFASYLHVHLGSRPDLASAFVASADRARRDRLGRER